MFCERWKRSVDGGLGTRRRLLGTGLLLALVVATATVSAGSWEVSRDGRLALTWADDAKNIMLFIGCDGLMALGTDMTGHTTFDEARKINGLVVVLGIAVDDRPDAALRTTAETIELNGRLMGYQMGTADADLVAAMKEGRIAVITNGAERYRFTLDGSRAALDALRCDGVVWKQPQ
ncbi:exported hypothetical protein [Thiocapsa sp. KS1]|nr:exported hypothetical protein [Thiocapsa sp. KS1]